LLGGQGSASRTVKFSSRWHGKTATFRFEKEPDDPAARGHARLVRETMQIVLPFPVRQTDMHPDLEALAAILIAGNHTGLSLTVARPVSTALAAAVAQHFPFAIQPVDQRLLPRARPEPGLPGLAYSGGADSTAALAVMPADTVALFMRRIHPDGVIRPMLYRDDAAIQACATLREQGRTVHIVETDLEYLRDPLGFPSDWANAIGLVLLADRLRLDSIAWGLIAESAYRIGHEAFADWAIRRVRWAALFEATGLSFNAPVAGVSEVGTGKIMASSPLGPIAQSCIRGGVGAPCGDCWKCFRKSLLDAAISGHWPDDQELDRLFEVREVDNRLARIPIPHEDVIGWICGRYPGTHPKMLMLRERTLPAGESFSWLEHWYGPSAVLMDPRQRESVSARLDDYVGRMSNVEEELFRAWDMTEWMANPLTRPRAEALLGHALDAPRVAKPPPEPPNPRDPPKRKPPNPRKPPKPRWRRVIRRLIRTALGRRAKPVSEPLDRSRQP
jgi:hypothetical protein